MGFVKFSSLSELTAPDHADLVCVVDVSTSTSYKSEIGNVLGAAADGSAATPGFAFADDADTGIFRIGADNLGIAVGGSEVVDVGASLIEFNQDIAFQSGNASSPGIQISGDADSGIYSPGGGAISIAVGGSEIFRVESGLIRCNQEVLFGTGTAAIPSISFIADTDSGFYRTGTNQFAVSTGGARNMEWETDRVKCPEPLELEIQGSDPSPSASSGMIYSKDVSSSAEVFAVDEAGNATQLTSHHDVEVAMSAGIKVDPDDMLPRVDYVRNAIVGVEEFRYINPSTGEIQVVQRLLPESEVVDWEDVQDAREAACKEKGIDFKRKPMPKIVAHGIEAKKRLKESGKSCTVRFLQSATVIAKDS